MKKLRKNRGIDTKDNRGIQYNIFFPFSKINLFLFFKD